MLWFWLRLKELRETNGLSQEQLANMLDVSRPTLTQIESDNREIKAHELKKLSEIFDVSIDFLLSGKENQDVHITKEQKQIFKELIIYILSKVWAQYNVGKTVLYKLLYFSEFDYYELTGNHISGYPFIKLPMWPAPLHFNILINEMEQSNDIITVTAEYWGYYQQRYIPNKPVDEIVFTENQKKLIASVLNLYANYKANEISELSHQDKPRQIAKDMDIIGYDLAKFREYPFSPRERISKKEEAQKVALASGIFNDLAHEPDLYEDYR